MTQVKASGASLPRIGRPCANCPFRVGMGHRFGISAERLEGFARATTFSCHNMTGVLGNRSDLQPCAGLVAVLRREGRQNAMMAAIEAMRAFGVAGLPDLNRVDADGEAYASWADVLRAHAGEEPVATGARRPRRKDQGARSGQ